MRLGAIGVAVAINVALAALLAYLWSSNDRVRWAEPAAISPSLEDRVTAPPGEPVEVSRYRETLERPLFASTRRIAPRAESGAEGQAADALKDVVLLGTYGSGERGGIIITSGGAVRRVAVGEKLGEWKVTGGEGRSVGLVRANGERRQLELVLNAKTPAPPAKSGNETAPEAAKEAVGLPADVTAGVPSERTRGAAPPAAAPAATGTAVSRDELRRQYRERLKARRAARGLPPLSK